MSGIMDLRLGLERAEGASDGRGGGRGRAEDADIRRWAR